MSRQTLKYVLNHVNSSSGGKSGNFDGGDQSVSERFHFRTSPRVSDLKSGVMGTVWSIFPVGT